MSDFNESFSDSLLREQYRKRSTFTTCFQIQVNILYIMIYLSLIRKAIYTKSHLLHLSKLIMNLSNHSEELKRIMFYHIAQISYDEEL